MMSVGNSSCSRHKGTCSDDGLGFLITDGGLCASWYEPTWRGSLNDQIICRDLFAGLCFFISGVVCHSRCVHSTSVRVCKLWTSVRHNLSTWCFDQRLCIQWYARAKPKSHGNHFGCHLRGKPLTLWLAGPQKLWTKATPIWRWKTTISPVNSILCLDTWCGGEKVHSYTLTVFFYTCRYDIKWNITRSMLHYQNSLAAQALQFLNEKVV